MARGLCRVGLVVVGVLAPLAAGCASESAMGLADNRASYPDGKVPVYRKFEVALALPTRCRNPFAPYPRNPQAPEAEQVDALGAKADLGGATVTGLFEGPGGKSLRVPGFWDEDDGAALWRIRMAPLAAGEWSYSVEVTDAAGTRRSPPQTFTAVDSQDPGFVRVAPGGRFFQFEGGAPFIPLGNNLVKTTNKAEIALWGERLRGSGMNSQRIWLHPHYTAIEWSATGSRGPSFVPQAPGLGRYSLRGAQNMDAIVETAEANGLYAILCQDDTICYTNSPHNEPRIGWEYNPYQALCRDGIEFFTNELAKRYYKRRLRYLVARWGYSTRVFAWELMNEVDWPYLNTVYPDKGDRWKLTDLVAWHDEMADYLRAADPYRRPVSTSTASNCLGWGEAAKWGKYDDRFFLLHAKMDFANHHLYELDEESLAKVIARFGQEAGGKPLLSGEWGLTPWFDKSEKGVTVPVGLHNALWIGLLTAGGTPYHWYWDKYFEVGGLAHYRAVAAFLQGEDTVREALRPGVGLARGPVPLSALGMIGPRRAWFWVWDLRSRQTQPQPTPVAGARLSFEGLAAGAYRAEFLDPWTGQALPGRPLTHAGGAANVELPTFTRDLAVKVAS